MICDVRTPGRRAVRRRQHGTCCARRSSGCVRWASTRSRSGPSSSTSTSRLEEDGRPRPLDAGGYFEETTLDASADLRKHTVLALEEMGIPVEYLHHEVGPSQHEIDVRYADGLEMADHCITYRTVVKEVAQKHGVYATFMPKPLFGVNGSGCTRTSRCSSAIVQRVLRRGRPLVPVGRRQELHRRPAAARARDIAPVRAVGEQLQAAGARLRGAGVHRLVAAQPLGAHPGAALPPRQGAGDPGRDPLPGSRPATRTWPSPGCLHAGLEGIEQGYELPDPMETNLYELTKPERRRSASSRCPSRSARRSTPPPSPSWSRGRWGTELRDRLVSLKRAEWDEYRVQVTPWELERYLPTLCSVRDGARLWRQARAWHRAVRRLGRRLSSIAPPATCSC